MLMEYSAVALQHMALRDFLAGPETLFPSSPDVLGEVRSTRPSTTTGGRSTRRRRFRRLPSMGALAAQAFPVPPTTKPAILKTLLAAASCATCATPTRRTTTCRSATCRRRQAQWFVLSQARLGDGVDPGRPRRHLGSA